VPVRRERYGLVQLRETAGIGHALRMADQREAHRFNTPPG